MDSSLGLLAVLMVLVPLTGGIFGFVFRDGKPGVMLAPVAAGLTLILAVIAFLGLDSSSAMVQGLVRIPWFASMGVDLSLGFDGINIVLVLLTALISFIALLTIEEKEKGGMMRPWLLILQSGLMGCFLALDLVFFYVCFELTLVPVFFLMHLFGFEGRKEATNKFIFYTLFGSLMMFVAAVSLYVHYFNQFGSYSSHIFDLYKLNLTPLTQKWIFAGFALAFAIKTPLFPFHSWQAGLYRHAPIPVVILLAAVMSKLGIYGFMRFCLPILPAASEAFAPVLIALGAGGIVYGSLIAWRQSEFTKLFAYSSLAHLGFIIFGVASFSDGKVIEQAFSGALLQMFNHGVITAALFLLYGFMRTRKASFEISDYRGLAHVAPWFATIFILVIMASIGLPGTSGFVGEFLLLLGLFQSSVGGAVFATTGVILGAIYMLQMCRTVVFGPKPERLDESHWPDLNVRELSLVGVLVVIILSLGIFPNVVLHKIDGSVSKIVENLEDYQISEDPPYGNHRISEHR